MNKEKFVTILQSTLYRFDGLDVDDIIKLNPDYDVKFVKIGIKLYEYLNK